MRENRDANLDTYVASFSKDAREIFEYFNFSEFVGQLNDAYDAGKPIEATAKVTLILKNELVQQLANQDQVDLRFKFRLDIGATGAKDAI